MPDSSHCELPQVQFYYHPEMAQVPVRQLLSNRQLPPAEADSANAVQTAPNLYFDEAQGPPAVQPSQQLQQTSSQQMVLQVTSVVCSGWP